ncbi:SPOSA6832_02404, partial [Sporobolomyces salmonicolor]
MASLASLLEQSQRLQTAVAQPGVDLPSIQLGLDQIESQSRRIAGRSLKENGTAGNAAYLLASGGVNADQLSSNINSVNLTNTFEPLLPLSDTDVEGYLRHTHEQTIISAIEEGRRATTSDFYRNLDSKMRRDWEKQKEKLFEELGRHQAGAGAAIETPRRKGASAGFERGARGTPLTSASSSLQMHSKMMRYDRVIRRLNEFRKEGYAFGVVSALGEASVGTSAGDSTTETWRLLSHVVQERDVLNGEFQRTALQERQYAKAYLADNQETQEAVELRKMISDGGRAYLEEQFLAYVEKTLASRPAEAGLGGVPSIQNKIRAFLNVKYQKNGSWSNPALEVGIANNTPVWARIYYLLRSGHAKEALQFATENEAQIQKLEKSFVPYFKAWLDSPDLRLPKLLRDRFLAEYNQRIRYLTDTSDPYKHALYKLIGRVEISRRNVPGVTQTTEDWLWFQLMLAIGFLQQHSAYQADAVHFAIALCYYGLIRVPSQSKTADVELRTLLSLAALAPDADSHSSSTVVDPTSPTPSLNFARLIHRYTRAFVHSDAVEALQYLYLVCLNADLQPPRGEEQVSLAHEYVRELVMETRQYSALLGDVRNDGTKVPGQIERDLKLLHLPDSRSYLLGIVKSAAQRADSEQRFSEAILLYNLAEEYDAVIAVLNVELGNSLSKPSTSIAGRVGGSADGNAYFRDEGKGTVGMAAGQEDVAMVARSILEHYDRSAGMGGKVSRKRKETCEVLMRLKEAMGAYEQGKLEQALQAHHRIDVAHPALVRPRGHHPRVRRSQGRRRRDRAQPRCRASYDHDDPVQAAPAAQGESIWRPEQAGKDGRAPEQGEESDDSHARHRQNLPKVLPIMSINVVSHPLIQAKLSELRDARTPSHRFRSLVKELSTILGIEASRGLALRDVPGVGSSSWSVDTVWAGRLPHVPRRDARQGDCRAQQRTDALCWMLQLQSPIATYTGKEIAHRIGISPSEPRSRPPFAGSEADHAPICAISPSRWYRNDRLYAPIRLDWGLQIENIKLLVLLGSKPGLDKVAAAYPGLEIFVGGIDDQLTQDGMIIPGLGDSGDRLFSTLG